MSTHLALDVPSPPQPYRSDIASGGLAPAYPSALQPTQPPCLLGTYEKVPVLTKLQANASRRLFPTVNVNHKVPPVSSPRSCAAKPFDMPPPSSTVPQSFSKKRKLAAKDVPSSIHLTGADSSPSISESSLDPADTDYTPSPRVSTLKRGRQAAMATAMVDHDAGPSTASNAKATTSQGTGGAKGGGGKSGAKGGSRQMSREALRKANHSLIERRRREKINAALGELRDMVPGLGEASGGKGGEFKLEVLERTVTHMRDLITQVETLENRLQATVPTNTTAAKASSSKSRSKASRDVDRQSSMLNQATIEAHASRQPDPGQRSDPRKPSSSPPTPSLTPERSRTSPSPEPISGIKDMHDPNETESETNLPPPFALASRHPTLPHAHHSFLPSADEHDGAASSSCQQPTIASLIASANQYYPDRSPHPLPSSRPPPPSHANNPTLYLPFPTPSPTSPFLSYGPSSSSVTSGSTGPPEPSPFLAPLQGMPLFGGALSLDSLITGSPADALAAQYATTVGSVLHLGQARGDYTKSDYMKAVQAGKDTKDGKPGAKRDMEPEEAANVLLAFSSPDVMRPTMSMTPIMIPTASTSGSSIESANGASKERWEGKKRSAGARRGTLESEEFMLDGDGGSAKLPHKDDVRRIAKEGHEHNEMATKRTRPASSSAVEGAGLQEVRGKTAREILEM